MSKPTHDAPPPEAASPEAPDPDEPTEGGSHRPHLSLARKLLFALVTVVLFFGALELGLRAAGMGRPQVIGDLQFGYEGGIPTHDQDGIEREGFTYRRPLFEEDERLFWKPIGPSRYTGRSGFRSPEPDSERKREGTYRFAVLGDSCSFLGRTPYPDHLAEAIEGELEREVDFVNASCPGYTSFQGLRRTEDVFAWDPDLLIVYFGWNDHWKSLNGLPDRDLAQRREMLSRPENWLQRSRIVRVMRQLLPRLRVPERIENLDEAPVRVPPGQYREHLLAIVEQAAERGRDVLLITAPTGFRDGAMPGWADGFFGNFYQMSAEQVEAIPRVHEAYCDIVREIASSHGNAWLVDAGAAWEDEPASVLFRRDQIHLTDEGHEKLAELIFDVWRDDVAPSID